jgi:hypothetical protein
MNIRIISKVILAKWKIWWTNVSHLLQFAA